jgi:Raf kinase inhibitor-like YbhB/YbcL family protein
MPTPGSPSYDVQRSRLRSRLSDEGLSDEEADAQAADTLRRQVTAENPAARTDRAAGPLGESGGGGDPGTVIELRSPAFNDHTLLPNRCARDDANLSPALEWSAVPDGTIELALVCEDRDTPQRFIHWLVSGIDPATPEVDEGGKIPGATTWPNGFGEARYDGPHPPIGDEPHRYVFRLYALDRPLDLPPGTPSEKVRDALEDRHLDVGTLVGLFAR